MFRNLSINGLLVTSRFFGDVGAHDLACRKKGRYIASLVGLLNESFIEGRKINLAASKILALETLAEQFFFITSGTQ